VHRQDPKHLTRRSDTPSSGQWIARLGASTLLGLFLTAQAAQSASAQILGNATPGTPGAIDGEFRTRPLTAPPVAAPRGLRPPDPEVEGIPASRRYGIRRAGSARSQAGAWWRCCWRGGFAGASPSGLGAPAPLAPTPRDSQTFTGANLGNTGLRGPAGPAPSRPSVPQATAPGLYQPPTAPQRRPPREDDPYAQLGIRSGGMVLRPAIEVSGGYDTNPTRAANAAKSSPLYRTEASLDAASDWTAHRLDIALRGSYTGFTALDSANRPEGDARIALRLDATRDLTFDLGLTAKGDTEGATSVNLPGGATGRTPYYTYGGALGATQRFGYTTISLRSNVDRATYGEVKTATGTASQEARNYTGYGLRLRAGYEVTPGIAPFVEVGVDRRIHDLARDTSGYARDSNGITARVGSTVELARSLTGEVSAGYTIRAYEDARLQNMKAPLVEGSLVWSASPLTTLAVNARSEIAETTLAGSSGARVYRASTTLTHAFLRNFTAAATLGVTKTDYESLSRQETGVNGTLRLEYKFNRMMALRGSYTLEKLNVNTPGENYTSHAFMLGMRYTP
jgi:hypothetical protein